MNNFFTLFLACLLTLVTSSSHGNYSAQGNNLCIDNISQECLFKHAVELIINNNEKYRNLTILRFIGISASFNRQVPIEIYELIPNSDQDLADDYYFAGLALFFGINNNRDLWDRYLKKSNSPIARQWASSFYARHLTLKVKSTNLFIEKLFKNSIEGYGPLIEAQTFYAIKTGNQEYLDSIVDKIINSNLDSTDKLQQIFSVISALLTGNNIVPASSVFKKAEEYFSNSIFWHSFSSAVSALHSANNSSDPRDYLAMIENTRFKSVVYAAVVDLTITNNNSELILQLIKDISTYTKLNSSTFDNNTSALLILKLISLMYIL